MSRPVVSLEPRDARVRPGGPAVCALLLFAFAALGARLPAASQSAPLGSIRGTVSILHPLSAPAPRPMGEHDHDYPAAPPAPLRQAVVYIETAPQSAFEEREDQRARLDQRNEEFVPHIIAIRTGTVVDFPNDDAIYHNVFSLSGTKKFDLGRYAAGHSRAVRFDRAGIVRVFCDIHSHMSAFILVFNHRFFAVTDEQGRYRIDRVPPGNYVVTAWYEGNAEQSSPVTVPAGGGVTELNFKVH